MKFFLPKTARLIGIFLSICLFAPLMSARASHPLDPLSADESLRHRDGPTAQ
jgi:hypothetical protein